MEVRFESMVFLWDDKIPTMFLEFVNLLTLTTSEGELRKSVKEFAEKHELDKFFLCKYPLIPTLWMIFEDSTFAFRSGDKHRSRRIYGK